MAWRKMDNLVEARPKLARSQEKDKMNGDRGAALKIPVVIQPIMSMRDRGI